MAKKILGPWSVQFPVRFHSGGDTTAQAFGKHINEIDRIYGLLNSLDVAKIGNEELTELITSIQNMLANQKHNALKDIQGGSATERYHLTKTQVDKLNGAPAGNDHNTSLTGHQGGSATERYHLTKAQVDKVNGAAAAGDVIKNHNSLAGLDGGGGGKYIHLTQAQLDKLNGAAGAGDIIKNHNSLSGLDGGGGGKYFHLTEAQLNGLSNLITNPPKVFNQASLNDNGYIKFENGFIFQWGLRYFSRSEQNRSIACNFTTAFTQKCFGVIGSYGFNHHGAERSFLGMWPRGDGRSQFGVSIGDFYDFTNISGDQVLDPCFRWLAWGK